MTARATDDKNGTTTSSAITIVVNNPNGAPAVTITSPANNSNFVAPAGITINATATDDGAITKVEFYNGTTLLGEDASSPYSFAWSNVAAGTYTITARAYDNGGLSTTSSAITVVVNANQNPTVSITSPTNNATYTAPASVTINATAADADGTISKVEFFNGATKLGEDANSPYSFAWTNVAAGTYTLTARATDDKNVTTTSSAITIVVNNPNGAPAVNITSPANNSNFVAPASITINATATDDGAITKVEFYNGATKLGEDATSPYSFAWSGVAAGTYNITAIAYDNGGLSTTSTAITVKVNENQTPVVTVSATTTGQNTVSISATATDGDGSIVKVEYYDGTTKIGESTSAPFNFTWTNAPAGTHSITAVAIDDKGGKTTSSAVTVVINNANQAPSITITSPANNASINAGTAIDFTVSAVDPDGSITKVEFFNGAIKLGESTTSPYSFSWTNAPAGTYSIKAVATDNQGATVEDEISIAVVVPTSVVNGMKEIKINFYPNPTNDIVNFSTAVNYVNIYSLNGSSVSQVELGGADYMNISELSSGIYMLEVITAEGRAFVKISKE